MRHVHRPGPVLLRNLRSMLPLLCLVLAGGCFTSVASAQANFTGVLNTVVPLQSGPNLTTFRTSAIDAKGNLYVVAESQGPIIGPPNASIVEYSPQGGSFSAPTTLVTGSNNQDFAGIAIDASGDIYYTDIFNNAVLELTPNGSGGYNSPVTLAIAVTYPQSIAVDASGDLYIASYGGGVYEEILSGATYTQAQVWGGAGFGSAGSVAVDGAGNVYVAQPNSHQFLVFVNQGGGTYTQTTVPVSGYQYPAFPSDAVLDSAGDVFLIDGQGTLIEEVNNGSFTYTQTFLATNVYGPESLVMDGNRNLFIVEDAQIEEFETSSINFGSQPVAAAPGTSTDTIALPFSIAAGQTVGAVSILTTGATGLDFTDAGSSTCTAQTYTSATNCVVNVNFTPLAPGLRQGAVVIFDGNNVPLVTVPLYGTGTGPLPTYAAFPTTYGAVPTGTFGIAFDGAGNLYTGNGFTGQFLKTTPNGVQTNVGSGFLSPTGVAVDGAGNVYIVDTEYGELFEVTPAGVQTQLASDLTTGTSVAVDGSGNLYFQQYGNSFLTKLAPSGATTQIGSGIQLAQGIALDSAGNLYVADNKTGDIYEITPSGTQTTLVSGLEYPNGIALDAAGNLYIAVGGDGSVRERSTDGTLTTIASGGFDPFGIALDNAGNIYYSDPFGGEPYLNEILRSSTLPLTFANTQQGSESTDSAKTAAVTNLGNAPLTFSAISYPADFPEDSSGAATDCTASTSLAPNSACTFTIDFKPVQSVTANTPLFEAVTATTNYLTSPYQYVSVAGTETRSIPTVATPTFSLPSGTYPAEQTVTITDATPNTTIFYTVDGSTPTTASALYRGPVPVYTSETLQAIAVKGGMNNSSVASAQYIVQAGPPTATPVLVPGSFSGNNPTTVTITDSMPGSTFYYTVNGTTPTIESPVYTGPLTIGNSVTLKAIAVAPGYSPSSVVSGTYTLTAANPIISLASGTYTGPQTVTITTASTGASIFYTTNGSTPNVNATKYTGPITVSASETLTAIAQATGYAASSPVSATYYISAPPSAPAFSPAGGTYNNAQSITLSDTGSNATFYYTLDGSMPTTASHKYTGPISMQNGETINAVAFVPGYGLSSVGSATYALAVATPVVSVPAGTYSGPQTVSVTTATTGAAIFYSTNGTPATASSARYTGPITVNSSETLNVIALATGYTPSATVAAKYYIGQAPTTPVLSLNSGVYNNNQTVSISESAPGATIYYTLNGSTPTTTSPKYTSPITINNSVTLNAIAVEPGYNPTAVASATYTLTAANPVISLASGSYTGAQTVTVTTASTNAILVYTTNGNQPVPGSTKYTGPITVNASETLRVMAIATGYNNSAIVTNTYTIH